MNLSLVIPVYNIEQYITPMFNSLLDQSDPHFEVIIVDDGSTDNTYNVIEKILSRNPALFCKVIRTENHGVSAARNRGLAEATGNYVLLSMEMIMSPQTWSQPFILILKMNNPRLFAGVIIMSQKAEKLY